ncbi:helix-turn-helix domain-containing protein [Vibrio coralliilyticus]|uniref:helix-turn-helix domain-containing protein n=1 Tax=Vibrio coralliilyticus TaxID=190893 RepID=UPI000BAB0A8B|nr:AraC family transcriptional regulator [Vibrio coralliilyticus]NOI57650.1 helix-turn-helix transcriptional regulator [Vibrio coralliilyticus]PAT67192.1 AraC family transcriptional regulator [Vibrio coralliilyticus]
MLAIPVPFVVSLLLGLLAVTLYLGNREQAKFACGFLILCALTTAIVGLRWTFQSPLFLIAQPIFAALIPISAWYAFARTGDWHLKSTYKHALAPIVVVLFVFTQTLWLPPLDELLTAIYLFYGIALMRVSSEQGLLVNVTLGRWEGVQKARIVAGWMLIFSALIDAFISLDFAYNRGDLTLYILTLGHLILLPVLSLAVVITGINTTPSPDETEPEQKSPVPQSVMSEHRAREVTALLNEKILEKSLYLDPELTLSRLSRIIGVPAKQISTAVNQVHGKNISKLVNEYRIRHAQQALAETDESVTQILMNSGFQTKSNFNREFSRITGTSPSEYRKQLKQKNGE